MRFSHLQKQPTNMYLYNSYNQAPKAPSLTMEAFVAPANFDPDAQELNIVKAFAAYPNANKKYIFSVGTSANINVSYIDGFTYAYSENGGGYTTITSGIINWSTGSIKRHVIALNASTSNLTCRVPYGAIWLYTIDNVNSIHATNVSTLRYIHCNRTLNLTIIDDQAFDYCTNLTGLINFPSSVTYIGAYSFRNCTKLIGTPIIPSSISAILDGVFINCTGFSGIPDLHNIVSIGASAFNSCTGFTSVNIPNVITIGNEAFANCQIAGTLNIPKVITINNSSFGGCNKLTSIYCPLVEIIKDQSFDGCSMLTNVLDLPKIKTIGSYTFRSPTFTSVRIGNQCTSIGYNCFHSNLASIYSFSIIPTTIVSNSFVGVNKTTCILHVPVGSLAAYQAAPYWNEFTNIIDDL